MRLQPRALLLAVVILGAALGTSAEPLRITVGEANPWTHLELNNDPDRFQFAIVADRTGGHRQGVFEEAVRKLNLLQPEFVISVGDLIEGYTEDREHLQTQWDQFVGLTHQLEMPFFYLPGNHDITNQTMAQVWEERFGPSYYHFVYRNVLFLCLNSEDGRPTTIGPAQQAYIRQALDEHPEVRWTLVFLHKPLWDYRDAHTGWNQVEAMLADRPHTVFAGHYHTYALHRRHGQNYFVLATTGGGSSLAGPLHGQFDHLVWVTMTDQGPQVANLMLEGIWDERVRTAEAAALMNTFMYGRTVSVAAILTEERRFRSGASQVRLVNDGDYPLHIQGAFADDPLLTVTPQAVDVVVPPQGEEHLAVRVTADRSLPVDRLQPVPFIWSAEYQQREFTLPPVEGQTNLVVSPLFELDRQRQPLTVDGDLSDWKSLPFVVTQPAQIDVSPESWTGPADCSWRFGVIEGPEYLYIGVEVIDDRPIYTRQLAWQQDGLEVRLDGRPDPERSANRGYDDNLHLLIALSPGHTPEDERVFRPEVLDSLGVIAVSRPTAQGYNCEMAIPLRYFEERQGDNWEWFRLNIAVDDFDEEAGPLAQLWWQPDWRDPTNLPGSGTFRRRKR